MYEYFRIGVATEGMAFGDQRAFEYGVVFDDPVVYQRQPTGVPGVGVSVAIVRGAVGGPAGVADAQVAGGVVVPDQLA